MSDAEEIERLKKLILDSGLDFDAREGLFKILETAGAEASATLKAFAIQWVRHVVGTHAEIRKAIATHEAGCPLKDTPKGKIGIVLQFCKCWPLMIAGALILIFSPCAGRIVDILKAIVT
jgi:hypothetical protein